MNFQINLTGADKAREFIQWADDNGYHHNWHYSNQGYMVDFHIEDEQQATWIILRWS